jgi:nucleoside-diphosphate-sugar epimerase
VVNCTAAGGGGPEAYQRVYVEGTRNLISWLKEQPPQWYVYTSSTSVYGQNDGSWVTEECSTEPAADTGTILLAAERLILAAHRESGFPGIILRLAGIYGPDRGFWFKQFLNGQAKLDGDGSRFLNMIHRDDVTGAIVAALEFGKPGEIYNVVDEVPVAQKDLFAWLSETLDKPMPPSVPLDDVLRKRGATNKRLSNRKLKQQLNYSFRYPTFREGFRASIQSSSGNL